MASVEADAPNNPFVPRAEDHPTAQVTGPGFCFGRRGGACDGGTGRQTAAAVRAYPLQPPPATVPKRVKLRSLKESQQKPGACLKLHAVLRRGDVKAALLERGFKGQLRQSTLRSLWCSGAAWPPFWSTVFEASCPAHSECFLMKIIFTNQGDMSRFHLGTSEPFSPLHNKPPLDHTIA
eukprot:EG_transcript_29872